MPINISNFHVHTRDNLSDLVHFTAAHLTLRHDLHPSIKAARFKQWVPTSRSLKQFRIRKR